MLVKRIIDQNEIDLLPNALRSEFGNEKFTIIAIRENPVVYEPIQTINFVPYIDPTTTINQVPIVPFNQVPLIPNYDTVLVIRGTNYMKLDIGRNKSLALEYFSQFGPILDRKYIGTSWDPIFEIIYVNSEDAYRARTNPSGWNVTIETRLKPST